MTDERPSELRRLDDWRLKMLEEAVERIDGKLDAAILSKADKCDLDTLRNLVVGLLVSSVLLFGSGVLGFLFTR
jgi:hypothetical protein